MTTTTNRARRAPALSIVLGALAAPAASAAPLDPVANTHDYVAPATPPTPVPQTPASDGFDWSDAGIGAAAVLGLTAIAAGGAVATGRRLERHPAAQRTR